jgi:hypothetical protein
VRTPVILRVVLMMVGPNENCSFGLTQTKSSYFCTYDLYGPVCNAFGAVHHPLLGQVGGGWALEMKTFLGPVKCHRDFQGPTPLPPAQVMDAARIKRITHRAV